MWRITSPGGGLVTEGSIPDKSEFILPVTIKSGLSDICYIYYDNQAAWPVGAVLEEERYGRKDGKHPDLRRRMICMLRLKPTQTIIN